MSEKAKRHNAGKLRWRNIPHFMLKGLVEVGQYGEQKYGETWNFLKGDSVSSVLDSLIRHYEQLESPFESDFDKESGKLHAYHIAWNALYLAYILEHKPEFDDRYKMDKKEKIDEGEYLNKLAVEKLKGHD